MIQRVLSSNAVGGAEAERALLRPVAASRELWSFVSVPTVTRRRDPDY